MKDVNLKVISTWNTAILFLFQIYSLNFLLLGSYLSLAGDQFGQLDFWSGIFIPVWVSISDGHWKISIHFQKIREITSCNSEKKSDFHITHEEIILNCCYLTNFLAMQKSDFHMTHVEIIFKLLLFDKIFWPCRNLISA